jgi:hypothetical protein
MNSDSRNTKNQPVSSASDADVPSKSISEAIRSKKEEKTKLDIALGELLRVADPISKRVISAYSHNARHDVNQAAISAGKFKVEMLERCAEFLNLPTRTDDNKKIYKNKPVLADHIIFKIESFFENVCDECNTTYQHHIADAEPPKLICFLCLQGSHNCQEICSKLPTWAGEGVPKGFVWVCHGCRIKNDTRISV